MEVNFLQSRSGPFEGGRRGAWWNCQCLLDVQVGAAGPCPGGCVIEKAQWLSSGSGTCRRGGCHLVETEGSRLLGVILSQPLKAMAHVKPLTLVPQLPRVPSFPSFQAILPLVL